MSIFSGITKIFTKDNAKTEIGLDIKRQETIKNDVNKAVSEERKVDDLLKKMVNNLKFIIDVTKDSEKKFDADQNISLHSIKINCGNLVGFIASCAREESTRKKEDWYIRMYEIWHETAETMRTLEKNEEYYNMIREPAQEITIYFEEVRKELTQEKEDLIKIFDEIKKKI